MTGLPATQRIETVTTKIAAGTLRHGQRVLDDGQQAIQRAIRWLGFWAAIILPLLYLPVFAVGIGPQPSLRGFGLLGCHLLALVAGHNYDQDHS
ncbi:MAG: hypothetical protein J07HN4v3_02073 [Halonotius sp. J07HN4]|jgi:hypothetical protein|nr:MAG: hypothetical protein J07HN4v3_02073 [Halonotius sp. J07HN4]